MKMRKRWKRRYKRPIQSYQDAAWDIRFQELKAYRREYGHLQVPSCSKTHPSLGNWVNHQRVLYRSGRLKPARKQRLEQVGFDWVSRGRSSKFRDSKYWDKKWERMLRRLASFYQRFGHCRVPGAWAGTTSLSGWVKRQRSLEEEGLLSQERRRRLKAVGMDWKKIGALDPRWELSFVRLREFRRRFGHCRVPAEWAENLNLSRWVMKMRRLNRAGRLSAEKVRRLNEVDFIWDPAVEREAKHDAVWLKRLDKLLKFHAEHGHWRVPTDQRKFHSLRVWMDNQRISYKRGWLTAERIRRLEEVNFPWVSERQRQAESRTT